MNKANFLYKKASQKLSLNQDLAQVSKTIDLLTENKSESEIFESHSIDILYECNKDILNNRREAKLLHKIQAEMMDIYVDKMKHLSKKTANSYSHIISKFIHYSPTIDPSDLDRFIVSKFKLPHNKEHLQSNLKGTALKYYNCIYSFLCIVYNSKFIQLNPTFAIKHGNFERQKDDIPTLLETTNAYIELMNKEMYEDALIIHLIYSLGASPEAIALLTFDSINEDCFIQYFDTKGLEFKNVKLNENLMRDIMFLKSFREKNQLTNEDQSRCYRDKLVIVGEFIISVSATAIYNRFSRGFGGALQWFKYSPQQIIKLSKAVLILKKEIDRDACLDLVEDTIQFNQKDPKE